jgi:hypothetical protein
VFHTDKVNREFSVKNGTNLQKEKKMRISKIFGETRETLLTLPKFCVLIKSAWIVTGFGPGMT